MVQKRASVDSASVQLSPAPAPAAHWVTAKPSSFQNPWPSFRQVGLSDLISMGWEARHMPGSASSKDAVPVVKPTWGQEKSSTAGSKATWLGHACFFVELENGARVLFDPVFSDRCSPSQYMGPKRFTEPPCKIEDIPPVDVIVISHNHYDHMDTHTLKTLYKCSPRMPHIFAPLGNHHYFESIGIPKTHYHTLDWWQHADVTLSTPQQSFTLTCTPAQHMTARGLTDRFRTLWSSWVITSTSSTTAQPQHIFFAGDTGYQAVSSAAEELTAPVCPAFCEIGEKFGEIEFAMIPIGAYEPRWFMSSVHCAPQNSVRVFKDVRAKRAVGMHWGTWVLTTEDVKEPPKKLKEECQKIGIEEGKFVVCDIGETLFI